MVIELFCGTAGATAAFKRRGYSVVTMDIDAAVRPGVVGDVRHLPFAVADQAVELLWCSFPCNEFSELRRPRVTRPSLELVFASYEAVRWLRPKYWIFENVRGAIRHLGIPVQKIGPWCLWGYFPEIRVSAAMQYHRKSMFDTAVGRGAIPWELSEALFEAVVRSDRQSLLDMRPFRKHRHVAAELPGMPGFDPRQLSLLDGPR